MTLLHVCTSPIESLRVNGRTIYFERDRFGPPMPRKFDGSERYLTPNAYLRFLSAFTAAEVRRPRMETLRCKNVWCR